MRKCKGCGATFIKGETLCPYCGTPLAPGVRRQEAKQRRPQNEGRRQQAPSSGFYAGKDARRAEQTPPPLKMFERQRRDYFIAAVLAFALGTFGAHWFFLGKPGRGMWYAIFCWTGIPTIIGIVEGIGLLRNSLRSDITPL